MEAAFSYLSEAIENERNLERLICQRQELDEELAPPADPAINAWHETMHYWDSQIEVEFDIAQSAIGFTRGN